jgi:hypothetical protein
MRVAGNLHVIVSKAGQFPLVRLVCACFLAVPPHHTRVRVLPHIKKLDDCFGQFLVRVNCACGAVRGLGSTGLIDSRQRRDRLRSAKS